MDKQVDILLATYQGSQYLEQQLESIFSQTYTHFHLWVRDDDSSDHTSAILRKWIQPYPQKMTWISTHPGQRLGPKGNFSELMNACKASYILFSDQDDYWLPTKVSESMSLMLKNEALFGSDIPLLVHTDLFVADSKLQVLSPSFWKYSRMKPHIANSINRLLTHNVITGCTMLINRPLLQLAWPIPKEAIMHDWWIGLVASAFGRIDFLPHPTLFYRQHDRNDIGAKNWCSWANYGKCVKKCLQSLGRKELKDRLGRTYDQSSIFFKRYENMFENDSKKKRVIEDYVKLRRVSAWNKRYLFLKNRYFKSTFSKSLGMFFLM